MTLERTSTLVGLAVLILSCPTHAQTQQGMFVGYDNFCGLPVVVGSDPQMASARRDQQGNPYIHMDQGAMSNWTISRVFALAHECAHHKLGHTNALGIMDRFRGGTARQELEADCWAARKLRGNGHFFDLDRTILEQASRGHFPPGQGYPSGMQRAQNIVECSQMTACNHRAHPRGHKVPCQHIQPLHRADPYLCVHPCPSPIGAVPCHPQGDPGPCKHLVSKHRSHRVQCTHPRHPAGH